ncbi:glycosyltransferase 87 family protein [Limibacter armeniacum]|uniref:glycosyltransferase 87 family protein n=1 Tax=Limibacter armeniacum TaxID=466084 RepID=UPI002FE68902
MFEKLQIGQNKKLAFYLLLLLSLVGYYWLMYESPREHFFTLILIWGGLFLMYWLMIKSKPNNRDIWIAIMAFRAILLFAIPTHSDDIYRFIWDGILNLEGGNPFEKVPSEWMNMGSHALVQDEFLYKQMNSPEFFTIYPPVCQVWFTLGAFFYQKGGMLSAVVAMRFVTLLVEACTCILLFHFLDKSTKKLSLYALNPLVIIELTGNLHPEVWMVMGLIGSFYYLKRQNLFISALLFAVAVCAKLLPLMFLPLLLFYLGWRKALLYYLVVGGITIMAFLPYIDFETLQHLVESVDLYFRKFEFNASFYYVVRWIGFQVKGYNIIAKAGPALSLVTVTVILTLMVKSYFDKNGLNGYIKNVLVVLTVYLLMSPIVHPWYLTTLVMLGVVSEFKYPLIWSFTVILSYWAYQWADYHESMILIFVEYLLVFLFIFKEKSKIFE